MKISETQRLPGPSVTAGYTERIISNLQMEGVQY